MAFGDEVGRRLLGRTLLGRRVVLYRTEAGEPGFAAYNLGRGVGSSVREVIDAVSAALGLRFALR